ncbi:protein RKD1-like [Wolffia australiana]
MSISYLHLYLICCAYSNPLFLEQQRLIPYSSLYRPTEEDFGWDVFAMETGAQTITDFPRETTTTTTTVPETANRGERASLARPRSSSMSFEDISRFFYMPMTEAAKTMRVGLTLLKKRCRALGISRWPHRKIKSLNSLINNAQELGKGQEMEESIRREIEMLEKMPEMQLTEKTKKLRQACFKAHFKKRTAAQYQSPQSSSYSSSSVQRKKKGSFF